MKFGMKIHDKSAERELHTHTYTRKYTCTQVPIVVCRHHVQRNIPRMKVDNSAFLAVMRC